MTTTTEKVFTLEFKPASRDWFQPRPDGLTVREWQTLARLLFEGGLSPSHPDESKRVDLNGQTYVALESLTRFGFAQSATLVVNGRPHGVLQGWMPTDEGRARFDKRPKPQRYGCLCEHSLRIGCVCSEKTYCPNPEHFGNGCHGSHD